MSLLSSYVINTKWHTSVKIKVHIYFHDFDKFKHKILKKLNITRSIVNDIFLSLFNVKLFIEVNLKYWI